MNNSLHCICAGIIMLVVIYPLSICLQPSIINTILITCVGFTIYSIQMIIYKDSIVCELLSKILSKVGIKK